MNILERMLESISREVRKELVVRDLELYFVVQEIPDSQDYRCLGSAYSQPAAKKLWLSHRREGPCSILRIDLGKLLPLIERLGAIEKIV